MPDISKYAESVSGEALHLYAAYQRWVPILSPLAKEKSRVRNIIFANFKRQLLDPKNSFSQTSSSMIRWTKIPRKYRTQIFDDLSETIGLMPFQNGSRIFGLSMVAKTEVREYQWPIFWHSSECGRLKCEIEEDKKMIHTQLNYFFHEIKLKVKFVCILKAFHLQQA